MIRALLELIVTVIVAMAARAILGSLMRGFGNAGRGGFNRGFDQGAQGGPANSTAPPRAEPRERVNVAGELHKDPVCGMYVAETTQYQRKSGRDRLYYCSEECKEKHAVAARS